MNDSRMKLDSCVPFFAIFAALAAFSAGTLTVPARADAQAADCLNLAGYLSQIRAMPDNLSMHHQLVDLDIRSGDDSSQPSLLATQHALDLFYHPNLVTLGLSAAKNGGSYLHDFTAYQLDCAKVVTGDIFAAEGMSVIWEVSSHSANSLTLKRLTQGGNAEISGDLTVVLRRFQTISPTSFAVTSAYSFDTNHACGTAAAPTPLKETNILTVTEALFDRSLGPGSQGRLERRPQSPLRRESESGSSGWTPRGFRQPRDSGRRWGLRSSSRRTGHASRPLIGAILRSRLKGAKDPARHPPCTNRA